MSIVTIIGTPNKITLPSYNQSITNHLNRVFNLTTSVEEFMWWGVYII